MLKKFKKLIKSLLPLREPLSLINHMMLFEKVTARNDADTDILGLIAKASKIGILSTKSQANSRWQNIAPLFAGKEVIYCDEGNWGQADLYFVIGNGYANPEALARVYYMGAKCYVIEEGFIKAIATGAMSHDDNIADKFFKACAYTIDAKSPHFYPGIVSSLESTINSDFKLSSKDKKRAKDLIEKITSNHVSKYNCQPINEPEFAKNTGKKILVIDQAYRDFSVSISGGIDADFDYMLETAIKENKDAQIIVKTHVDKAGRATYFTRKSLPENVRLYSDNINPISIINAVDEVYTYSSTMGWEALMCGKKVHVFGSPIYAGWGLTYDKRNLSDRRSKKRSLEELAYFFYLKAPLYFNPTNGEKLEAEEAIDNLINLRNEYFAK